MIRKASMDDIPAILNIIADAKSLLKSKHSLQWQDADGYPNFNTFQQDVDKGSLYVVDNNPIVAVCSLGRHGEPTYNQIYDGKWLNDDPFYVIHRLAVKKEAYGKGFGKTLMQKMEMICLAEGIFNIRCDTTHENEPMNHLLLSLGYQDCGIIYLDRPSMADRLRKAYHKILVKK
ncbi:MAG TPA: GNAT family N-acetyltransferase [Bacilli bacterium]|nr:MAG: Acetyltransferase (GNAT) family protein [Tenericutes bacterium ADurb.BinA124]HNZ50680.1 GNAT family N-acetyltransferase [Bacilli bacterium]HPN61460.1 GNAT family N-acetyltransferase [Bacilli bacterium]HPX84084.1 GNAT family N-acetyltransferase [Bacilli bacterium]HQC74794.1 GNAT family N-acetyltransferase [Bacilli bacterium]